MDWQKVCENPLFKDIPFKVETNRWGHIEMTPASNEHGLFQACIIEWLAKLGALGHALAECSIQTSQGVKVADVAWGTAEFFRTNGRANPYLQCPEIVIEILSPSNSAAEMEEKKELYFARGAREFWLCEKGGSMRFFANRGALSESALVAAFPKRIDIDFA